MPICPPGSWSIRRVRQRSIWILAPCTVPQRRLQRPIAMVIRFSWRKPWLRRRHASRSSAPGPGGRFGGRRPWPVWRWPWPGGGACGPWPPCRRRGWPRRRQCRPYSPQRRPLLQRLRLPRRSLRNMSQCRPPRRRPWLLPRRLRAQRCSGAPRGLPPRSLCRHRHRLRLLRNLWRCLRRRSSQRRPRVALRRPARMPIS